MRNINKIYTFMAEDMLQAHLKPSKHAFVSSKFVFTPNICN